MGIALPETVPGRIIVGMGTCGLAAGAGEVWERVAREAEEMGLPVELSRTGCIGMCEQEVLLDVAMPGKPRVTYGHVTPEMVQRILAEHVLGGVPVQEWVIGTIQDEANLYPELRFFSRQRRIVLRNCGLIDPERLEDYLGRGGYTALAKALSLPPERVIEEVKVSGLRGRGGAGFSTGLKWGFARAAQGTKKYLICNADEGDPGAFMDRSVLEGDPHSVLEGMVIAAHAIGSDEGYIYVRAEYPLAIRRLRTAIAQAEEKGYLGENILGTALSFRIHLKEGAGAFVCGEETALIASIEGERGMPRSRPPFPANKGLWGCPTNNNNVETYANVSWIINQGGVAFAAFGTEKSKGSKVFALTGKIANTGLVEVEMGTSLREIIFGLGGGIVEGKNFKAVQIGGPSGGCLPASLLDTPVDYESLVAAGAMMGSGGMVVLDEDTCMVDFAKFFASFLQKESCGKCVPCREGTVRMLEILQRITAGKGEEADLERMEHLAEVMRGASLCALGQTAPNPVLSTMRYFADEYRAHVVEKRCPADVCTELRFYRVIADKCPGCTKCLKVCPAEAITGRAKVVHKIDPLKCTRCGECEAVCPFAAIIHR